MAVAAMAVGAMAVVLLPLLAAVSARGLPFLARRSRCSKSLSAALLLLPLLLRAGLELSRRLTDAWAERPPLHGRNTQCCIGGTPYVGLLMDCACRGFAGRHRPTSA